MIMLNSSSQVLQSNYDHVEQFISSSAMSTVVADNKLPNKSVNRLPYGLFALRLQTIPLSKTFAYTGVSLLTGLSCNLFEVINLRSDMTVYPNIAKQFPLQRYLLI